jgi:hypothetical protein
MEPIPVRQRVRAVANENGEVNISGLDLAPGEEVEIVVVRTPVEKSPRFPLRGKPIEYLGPLEPVSEFDWTV